MIFLDGESKSGKTAVGRAIKKRLEQENYSVELIVAGNFFRRLTWLALQQKPAGASDGWLEKAVLNVLDGGEIYDNDYDLATLEEPEVDRLVSNVGQLDFVQAAANPWRFGAADKALAGGADVIMLDGRNLRSKFKDWLAKHNASVALELVIACRAEVAAGRYLHDAGNKNPSEVELAATTRMIMDRRSADRNRAKAPYIDPVDPVKLVAGVHNVAEALAKAYDSNTANPPHPIVFDNSEVPRDIGLATVSELASLAIRRLA